MSILARTNLVNKQAVRLQQTLAVGSTNQKVKHLRVVKRAVGEGESKVTREYREDTGKITTPGEKQQPKNADGTFYIDEERTAPRKDPMSKEMKEKLRREYIGLGGSTNQAMGNNYFLYIILVVSFLAIASKLTGAI